MGRVFRGTYFIQTRLGCGGTGHVYRARHVILDQPVALKILRPSLHQDAAVAQRFLREARAVSRLRHPNVVDVIEFGEADDGTLFLAMEYVAGSDLARLIARESPLPEHRAVDVASQVLAALSAAHAKRILHRDLKPANVMVSSRDDGRDLVKVVDFGIAEIQAPGDADGVTLTQQGMVCGTPGYMSPEQWGEEPLDERSDLYAVGVLLYEMLTGSRPFDARTPLEVLRQHVHGRPRSPSVKSGRPVSPDLEALVMRAIDPSRENRPPTAEAMRRELLACQVPPGDPAPGGADAPRTTRLMPALDASRRRRWIAASAAALLVAAGGAGALVRARGRIGESVSPQAARGATDRPHAEPPAPGAATLPAAVTTPPPQVAVTSPRRQAMASASADAPRRRATEGAGARPSAAALPSAGPAAAPAAGEKPRPLYCLSRFTQNHPPPASSGYGVLLVTVEPYGNVSIEGHGQGPDPQECQMMAGEYRVQASHPVRGAVEATCRVVAGERRPCALLLPERGELAVVRSESAPARP